MIPGTVYGCPPGPVGEFTMFEGEYPAARLAPGTRARCGCCLGGLIRRRVWGSQDPFGLIYGGLATGDRRWVAKLGCG